MDPSGSSDPLDSTAPAAADDSPFSSLIFIGDAPVKSGCDTSLPGAAAASVEFTGWLLLGSSVGWLADASGAPSRGTASAAAEEVEGAAAAGVLVSVLAASPCVSAGVFGRSAFAIILDRSMMASRSASEGISPESFLKILWCTEPGQVVAVLKRPVQVILGLGYSRSNVMIGKA